MVRRGIACNECVKNCEMFHQKQGDPAPIITRFSKLVYGMNFSKFMYLPPQFARTVKHLARQETQIEDSSGQRWPVTLSYIDGSLAFRKGWHKFFLDHGLEEGYTLIFNYIKGSHFVVQIFKKSGCEKINFHKACPQQNKRFRPSEGSGRVPKTVSHDQPCQTRDVNFRDKPSSATRAASQSELLNRLSNPVMGNADSINMDDPICMINRDDGYSQGEYRNFLYDLSSFEKEKETPDANKYAKALETDSNTDIMGSANKFEKALDTKLSRAGTTEQTSAKGHDSQVDVISENQINGLSGDIFAHKPEKAVNIKMNLSHANEHSKTVMTDTNQINGNSGECFTDKFEKTRDTKEAPSHADEHSKMVMIDTNHMNDNSGECFADKFEKTCDTEEAPSHTKFTETTKTEGHDTQKAVISESQIEGHFGDIFTDKCEKATNIKMVPSHADIKGQLKLKGHGTKTLEVNTNEINGNSGDIFTDNFEKTCNTKVAPSNTEITVKTKPMGNDTKMDVFRSNQISGHGYDICGDKFYIEHSDKFNMKGISNDVCGFRNDNQSPSVGSSKIAEGEHAVKRRRCESSVSISGLKDLVGKHVIKKERVEWGEKADGFHAVSGGKEPSMLRKRGQMFSPVVKVEPDLSPDIVPSVALSTFSAEVKSLSYLELPVSLPSIPGRKERGRGKVVYLRDSSGRLWPLLYPDIFSIKALTGNWKKFCQVNNIKPGDKCRFQVENDSPCIYKVEVTRRSGGEFRGK